MFRKSRWPNKCWVVLGAVFAAGCSSGALVLPERGTTATVRTLGGVAVQAELLTLQDDTLFVLKEDIVAIPRDSIREVVLEIEQGRNWGYLVGLGQFLPAVVSMFVDNNSVQIAGGIAWALAVGTWGALEFSTPQALFSFPADEDEYRVLSLYFRFPTGIDRGRLDEIGTVRSHSP